MRRVTSFLFAWHVLHSESFSTLALDFPSNGARSNLHNLTNVWWSWARSSYRSSYRGNNNRPYEFCSWFFWKPILSPTSRFRDSCCRVLYVKGRPSTTKRLLIKLVVEVIIHTILLLRNVYPLDLFVRRKRWEVAVYQCKEEVVNDYVSGVIKGVAEEVDKVSDICV